MNIEKKPPFEVLLNAHAHIWRDPGFTLRERVAACALIWRIVCDDWKATPKTE